MASIPGVQLNITGASGSQGLLGPKNGWFAYVFPRGAWADQDSAGTLITFGSSAQASRFAANDWIQIGTATANIRKVSAVGGNSLSVSGAAVTVSEDNRVFLIGQTQPSTSGGSTTYTIPATVIRHRDDDSSDLYVNSMVTSNADGLIQWYATHGIYDVLIQDGNRSPQGYIADLPIGLAEGISTSLASVFGATVTINAALGVTGWATFGQTATFNAAIGVTGWATFGSTVTMNAALGVTGWATFGATVTMHANAGVTGTFVVDATSTFSGKARFGNSVSIDGALGVTGLITGVSATFSGYVDASRFAAIRGTTLASTDFTISSGWGATGSVILVGTGSRDTRGLVEIRAGGAGITDNPTVHTNFKDGTFAGGLAYSYTTRGDINAPTTAYWRALAVGSTQAGFTFVGLPVSGTAYDLFWLVIG